MLGPPLWIKTVNMSHNPLDVRVRDSASTVYTPNNLILDFIVNSLSAGPLNPGHQCPCLKSLIARPNCQLKNIDTAYMEAKSKLYKLSGQERVNCSLFVHPYINVKQTLHCSSNLHQIGIPPLNSWFIKHASSFCVSQCAQIITVSLEFCEPDVAGIAWVEKSHTALYYCPCKLGFNRYILVKLTIITWPPKLIAPQGSLLSSD